MAIQNNFPNIRPSLNLDFANTKTLDPRITFSRASTATYYDGKKVAKAEENLLLRSQEFDVWAKTSVTTQTNVGVAPDGTSTADLVYPSSTGTTRLIYRVDTAANALIGTTAQKVFSVYAKAYGKSWISFTDGSGTRYAHFNVSTGVVGTLAANHTASIVDVGGGWYRCVLSNSVAWGSPSAVCFGITDADNTNACTANGTDGVLFWGAQLEQRSSVTAYTPTTTLPITNYIPVLQTAAANVARFDHDPITGESLGLLIEEQRTNLLLRSQEFENASWSKISMAVTADQLVAPDGTLTADLLAPTVQYGGVVSPITTVVASTAYTISVYAKAHPSLPVTTRTTLSFYDSTGAVTMGTARFTWSGGVPSFNAVTGNGTNAAVTHVGNGWYRLSFTSTSSANTSHRVYIYPDELSTASFGQLFIWGAQLEAGAFPTSYIKTEAAQTTRNADAASMTGVNFSSWYRQDEGTMYIHSLPLGISALDRIYFAISFNQPLFQNSHTIRHYAGSTTITSHINGAAQVTITGVTPTVSYVPKQLAYAYKMNNYAGSDNGSIGSDATAEVPVVNLLIFPSNGQQCIKKFSYYPARLTNAQLQALTA